MKIVDCFTFYNEIDLLLFRLEHLYNTVDNFVIAEANITFSGIKKESFFQKNIKLFEKYQDKIIHVITEIPFTGNAWDVERNQRMSIDRGIQKVLLYDNDIITITDVDEIPDKNLLTNLKINKLENKIYTFEQDMYYYNLTCKCGKWYKAKIMNIWSFKNLCFRDCDRARYSDSTNILKGGWHFSYFGDVNYIKNKINSFSHQEFNNEIYLNNEKIIDQIKNCKDLFFRDNINLTNCPVSENPYLPKNYHSLLKFSNLYNSN
jgi:beta-1,4-mannosyl-glycoprotein beta-1,4-N-acetylglucosaminyltransferase